MGHNGGGSPVRVARRPMVRSRTGSLDHEIVSLFFDLMDIFKDNFFDAARDLDLTLPQAHLLMTLDEPVAMRDVAAGMGYDASHITSLVDRLEARGLVERRADPTDRRVKRIAITEGGAAMREQIEDRLFETIPPLTQLTRAQRMQLRDLLATATGESPA